MSSFHPSSVCEIRRCVFRAFGMTLPIPSSPGRLPLQHDNAWFVSQVHLRWNRSFLTRRRESGSGEGRMRAEGETLMRFREYARM